MLQRRKGGSAAVAAPEPVTPASAAAAGGDASAQGGDAFVRRSGRSRGAGASDAVRSEEEMQQILLNLLEQERCALLSLYFTTLK